MRHDLESHRSVAGASRRPLRPFLDGPPELLQMRIAQVTPLYEAVPPKFYGGTERSWRI